MKIWKTIPSFPNFEASDKGEIRTKERKCRFLTKNGKEAFSAIKTKIRILHENKGYLAINLTKDSGTKKVHRLVAEAFIPSFKKELDVDHIDGNRKNNHVNNIRMTTRKENVNNPNTKIYCLNRFRNPNGTFA